MLMEDVQVLTKLGPCHTCVTTNVLKKKQYIWNIQRSNDYKENMLLRSLTYVETKLEADPKAPKIKNIPDSLTDICTLLGILE